MAKTTPAQQALTKAHKAALEMIDAQPGRAAKVAPRGNLAKGIVSQAVADRLVAAGEAEFHGDGKWINTGKKHTAKAPTGDKPTPGGKTEAEAKDLADKIRAANDANANGRKATGDKPKVNGRKAAAEKSPYSTAGVAGRIKRHGKSRRTGTMTEIEDLLHKDSATKGKVEGSGRYAVRCLTHNTEDRVPDMTTAKPLQARTDQFCPQCKALVDKGAKHTPTTTDAPDAA